MSLSRGSAEEVSLNRPPRLNYTPTERQRASHTVTDFFLGPTRTTTKARVDFSTVAAVQPVPARIFTAVPRLRDGIGKAGCNSLSQSLTKIYGKLTSVLSLRVKAYAAKFCP